MDTNTFREQVEKIQYQAHHGYESAKEFSICSLCEDRIARILAIHNANLEKIAQEIPIVEEQDYSSGLLNDYGGGNIGWWHDYIRCEVGRCNDYWHDIVRQNTELYESYIRKSKE